MQLASAAALCAAPCFAAATQEREQRVLAESTSQAPETSLAFQRDAAARLQRALALIEGAQRAEIGVYVHDLDSGLVVSHRAGESWYLASTIKLPVALTVLRGVERGDFTLDTTLKVRSSDYVDGAGATNHKAVGTPVTLRALLEQMMIHSDNTASDMLIGLVGLREINAVVASLVPTGFEPITTLADVRRQIYRHIDPEASRLSGVDFLKLKQQRNDADRVQVLAQLLGRTSPRRPPMSVAQAYDAYYASGLNAGRLDAYGRLLTRLVQGDALSPANTAYLLEVMERTETGPRRLKAGLPSTVRLAHKTGTQRGRLCDSGVITVPRQGRYAHVVIAACTRGDLSLAGSERALRQVGAALCSTGFLQDLPDDAPSSCPSSPLARRAGDDGPDALR